MRRPKVKRSGVIFTVGLAGIVYETLHEKVDRPWLLSVFLLMMGLPATAIGDDWLALLLQAIQTRKHDEDSESSSSPDS